MDQSDFPKDSSNSEISKVFAVYVPLFPKQFC